MPDIYAILGVPRDANRAAIRKAYRSASKRAHPDCGGTPEKFRMVSLALEVLSDDARRKAYDQTGEINEKPVDNEQSEIMGLVSALLDAVLQNADKTGEPWESIDIVQRMLRIAAQKQTEMEQQRRAMKDGVTRQRRLLKRFSLKMKRTGQENRLDAMMVGRIAFLEGQDRMAVIKLETMRKAVALISEYKFESEKSPASRSQSGSIGNFIYSTF